MWAIFKKEVAVYFHTSFGYVFMGIFLLLSGIVFVAYNLIGTRGDIYGMFGVLNYVSIIIFPVLTMKLLAEEKRMATDQILFTSPISVSAIVVGKYLAAWFCLLHLIAGHLCVCGIYRRLQRDLDRRVGRFLSWVCASRRGVYRNLFVCFVADRQPGHVGHSRIWVPVRIYDRRAAYKRRSRAVPETDPCFSLPYSASIRSLPTEY